MDDLERRATELIAERQRLALGEQGVSDASAGRPALPASQAALYDSQPVTFNPAAEALPAKPAPEAGQPELGPESAADPEAENTVLDLPGLLAYAIANAPEYRTEKERLFLTTLSLIIERHEWGPRFFSSVSADLSGTPESGDYDTAADLISDFTVSQRLPYGGDLSVSALVNYTNLLQRASTTTSAGQTQDLSIGAAINLPLLRGSGKVARADLIQAERDLVYAARGFERFRREFFVDISNTYFSLLRQQTGIENQERQIAGLERLANEQRARFEAGKIPGFEADDAEAQVLFGRSSLARVRDDYASSLDSLKLRIGMPVQTPLAIERADIRVPTPALDPAESIKLGQSARLDLQTQSDRVTDAKRQVRFSRDRLRGDLDFSASLNLNSDSGTNIDGVDLDLGDSSYRAGLEYELPLDRKIELSQYRSSLIDLERSQRDFRTQRDRVALDIRDASRQIERATLVLDLQGRNVELAESRLENVTIRRRQGKLNEPRRLIEAEEDLLEARNTRDEALADLQTSVLNYLLETGQMRVDGQGRWLAPGTLVPPGNAQDNE